LMKRALKPRRRDAARVGCRIRPESGNGRRTGASALAMRRLCWSVFSVPACFLARYSWARICGGRGKRGVRGSRGSAELTRSPSNERVKRFRAESHLVQGGALVPVANLALAPVAHPARHLLGSEILHGGTARRVHRAHARREVDVGGASHPFPLLPPTYEIALDDVKAM